MDDSDATVSNGPSARRRSAGIILGKRGPVASGAKLKWAECYQTEMPYLIRYLIRCFDSAEIRDATDVAHNAFAELFEKWDTVQYPRAWLRKVAFRQMLRQPVRSEYSFDTGHKEPVALSAAAQLELREDEKMVLDALGELPPTQRNVFALIYDQFSYREIAEIMNISEEAVRQNAARARKKMKELLGLTDYQA
jgi:RNA polymerase sigma factor (sigma-70 family)